jgi:hypothetical protein
VTQRARRRLIPVLIVAVALLGFGAYQVGYRVNFTTGRVPLPAASASPEQVVLTYMDAFNHRDQAAMTALFPSRGTVNRFRAIGHYTNISVASGHPMSELEREGGVGDHHLEAYLVAVRLDYAGFDDADVGYTPGPNGWNYYLVRDHATDRWIIGDQGVL